MTSLQLVLYTPGWISTSSPILNPLISFPSSQTTPAASDPKILGKSILPQEFCQEDDKNLLESIIERDEVVLAESAKDFVKVEKSFFTSFAEG